MDESKGHFVRTASGLVRDMSIWDAGWYGILATGGFVILTYFFPYPQYYLGGVSLPLMALVTLFIGIPMIFIYAGLGSAMPRSGGDYIYQSRLLHPSIGFAVPMTCANLFWIVTFVISSFVVATSFISPVALLIGYQYNLPGLISLGYVVLEPLWMFILLIVIGLLAYISVVAGMKWYVKIQRYILIPSIIITHLAILYLLVTSSPADFIESFNYWGLKIMGEPDLYNTVLVASQTAGYTVPQFSLKNTLYMATIPGVWVVYVVFAAQGLLGEVKSANSMKSLYRSFAVALFYVVFPLIILVMVLFQRIVGWDFLHMFSYVYHEGLVEVPFYPTFAIFTTMLTTNPLLIILSSLAFLTSAYYFAACCLLNCSRILFAMSIDRLLPEWFSKVSPKLNSPVNAISFELILAFVWGGLWYFWEPFYFVIYSAASIAYILIVVPTGVAATLFPWKNKNIYDSSPVSKYSFAGIPLITIMGVWLTLASLIVVIIIAVVPELGAAYPIPRAVVFGLLMLCFVWYLFRQMYNARKYNIDPNMAFKEIPPE